MQKMRVEMVGRGFEELDFELSQPQPACIAVQPGKLLLLDNK